MSITIDGIVYLEGDGTWGSVFNPLPQIDGDDILVKSCVGTYFTGAMTASGMSADIPGLLGCALPMNEGNISPETNGSPIHALPYLTTEVRIYNPTTNIDITCSLIDLGPAKTTGHGIDLTEAAFEALGANLSQGIIPNLRYRILNGVDRLNL